MHHGQLCFSTERILVQRSIADRFLPLLKSEMQKIPSAGTAVDSSSASHALDILLDAQKRGAEFLFGSPEYVGTNSLKPALVTNVVREARIRDEETFGPSATVYVVDTDDDAVRLANDSTYGLNAAVHSTNWERALKVCRQLDYGQVFVNNMTPADAATQPIQGVKGSGWGSSNSIWGIREFMIDKVISLGPSSGAAPYIQ